MSSPKSFTILIYGSGLAAPWVAAALAGALPDHVTLKLVTPPEEPDADLFYGSVMGPSAYNFLLSIGIDEPSLIRETNTAFSYGTLYRNWPSTRPSWVQSYHLPLSPLHAVPFQHYLTRTGEALEPYLVSAQAALKGAFAHPPAEQNNPLSRAEYGYQISSPPPVGPEPAAFAARQNLPGNGQNRCCGERWRAHHQRHPV